MRGPGLEWSAVCVYGLSQQRGAEPRGQPPYPLAATAALHVTRASRAVLSTPDYSSEVGAVLLKPRGGGD